jgi:Trk K+ transport system NAD-binding subunit
MYRSLGQTAERRRAFARELRAAIRDTWVLMREFRGALLLFATTLILGAISFRALWGISHPGKPIRFIEALYDILTMTFFQPTLEFPPEWYLDLYFFAMPALGLTLLARGAADFVTLLFNRRSRLGQWEEAVASVMNNHIIVCGLGHLGLRVVHELVALGEDIVIIERRQENSRFPAVRDLHIPIILGDGRFADTLEKAGISRASAIVICSNDDLANLQMASRIRETNPDIRIVMRMFDDEFARGMAEQFGISAVMSASMLAAPAFAGAASRVDIIQMFKVDHSVLGMGRVEVESGTRLDGATISKVEDALDLSVVLLQTGGTIDVHPEEEYALKPGDIIAVVAGLPAIKTLSSEWNRTNSP